MVTTMGAVVLCSTVSKAAHVALRSSQMVLMVDPTTAEESHTTVELSTNGGSNGPTARGAGNGPCRKAAEGVGVGPHASAMPLETQVAGVDATVMSVLPVGI